MFHFCELKLKQRKDRLLESPATHALLAEQARLASRPEGLRTCVNRDCGKNEYGMAVVCCDSAICNANLTTPKVNGATAAVPVSGSVVVIGAVMLVALRAL